jgi:hypothetical protein
VIVNQLIGPVLCKLALKWSGEGGLASGVESHIENEADPNAVHVQDLNKVLILGSTSRSKALAISLLREKWGVVMLTMDQTEADALEQEFKEWADMSRAEEVAFAEFHGFEPPALPAKNITDAFKAIMISGGASKHPFLRSHSLDNLFHLNSDDEDDLDLPLPKEGDKFDIEIRSSKLDSSDRHSSSQKSLKGCGTTSPLPLPCPLIPAPLRAHVIAEYSTLNPEPLDPWQPQSERRGQQWRARQTREDVAPEFVQGRPPRRRHLLVRCCSPGPGVAAEERVAARPLAVAARQPFAAAHSPLQRDLQ